MEGHKRPGTLSSVWEGLKNFSLLVLPSGFNNLASSLRFVGSASNWQEDRLHLYFSEFFAGGEEIVLGNTQELRYNDMATSLIVTGCEPWTVFQDRIYEVVNISTYLGLCSFVPCHSFRMCQQHNLLQSTSVQGYAICVFPSSEHDCTPGFYPNAESLSSLAFKISSVRKGCFATTKIYPPRLHPRNSFTNLNPDLVMYRNMTSDEGKRNLRADSVH